MKDVASASGALRKSVEASDFTASAEQARRLEQLFKETEDFWTSSRRRTRSMPLQAHESSRPQLRPRPVRRMRDDEDRCERSRAVLHHVPRFASRAVARQVLSHTDHNESLRALTFHRASCSRYSPLRFCSCSCSRLAPSSDARPPAQKSPAVKPEELALEWFIRLNELDNWFISYDGKEENQKVVDRFLELYADDAFHQVGRRRRRSAR